MDLDGYAIGGLSVGEPQDELLRDGRSCSSSIAGGQGSVSDGGWLSLGHCGSCLPWRGPF